MNGERAMIPDAHDMAFEVNLRLGHDLSLFFDAGSTCDEG